MTKRLSLLAALAVTLAAVVVGWRTYERQPDAEPDPTTPSSSAPSASPSASPTPAKPPPVPRVGACYRLTYAQAVAPTTSLRDVPCDRQHTAVTFEVGELDTVVGGHLVTVDSPRVRDQVAAACPEAFGRFVGGTVEQQRLSLLRPVGFTPTVEQSDRGATWYRCDVVAVAGGNELSPLGPQLGGVLATEEGRTAYGLCATAGPGTDDFRTVICSAEHSWRAVRTVTFEGDAYPGTAAVREAGTQPCRAAGRAAAGGALDFRWGYEWPTAERWRAGRTYGICWVPA
ncbi:septum formation family protein [Nocardioides sp. GXQ0305]|uniref:septum formation family protein n=1 Tax=Nocardioides sp. GXQ0305 TaxID=3423912 RepID=UPI003D7CE30A